MGTANNLDKLSIWFEHGLAARQCVYGITQPLYQEGLVVRYDGQIYLAIGGSLTPITTYNMKTGVKQ